MTDPVFVFGSNRAGRHGKGAALWARQHRGAIYGQGEGLQGNSYAIPTKGHRLEALGLDAIHSHVARFLRFANERRDLTFQLTPIGCGLAGYKPGQIAPMFRHAPPNVILPDEFATITRLTSDLAAERERNARLVAETIERCAKVAELHPGINYIEGKWRLPSAHEIAAAIRALAQESKP